jgi:hypothetical protein
MTHIIWGIMEMQRSKFVLCSVNTILYTLTVNSQIELFTIFGGLGLDAFLININTIKHGRCLIPKQFRPAKKVADKKAAMCLYMFNKANMTM